MRTGLPSPNHPSENTLTVNITHEQLKEFESHGFDEAVAVSPTRVKESDYAYDIAMDWNWAKVFIQQFKRPFEETGSIQNKKGTERHVKFEIDEEQIKKLKDAYDEGQAFLTFPLVRDRHRMPNNLSDTVFVDVHGIPMQSPTIAYIHNNWREILKPRSGNLPKRRCFSDIKLAFYNTKSEMDKCYWHDEGCLIPAVHINTDDEVETVDPTMVKTWELLLEELLSCESGILLRGEGDRIHFHQEEPYSPAASAVVFGGDQLPEGREW